ENKMVYVRASATNLCPAFDSIMVNLAAVNAEADPAEGKACREMETQLSITNLDPDDQLTFVWSPALDPIANPTVTTTTSTVYTATVTNQFGCTASFSIPLTVTQLAVAAEVTGPDTICIGQTTTLLATATGDGTVFTYQWTPANTLINEDTAEPTAQPQETTDYIVQVTDENGCVDTATVRVHFMSGECVEPYIFVPTAFTPDNSGKNDYFIVRGLNITELYFVVWDRWGEKVYETTDVKAKGWDGTHNGRELTADAYAWYVRARCGNGAVYTKKGNVTLLK
ncbi:MAG: gliding motility-associated C-terminal domain-containing protein, partial [Saprospiraceae bacterium]|nr:gliding motility-associated C-terminal domain-containing protein [Saprospiraceae bacterium]